MVRTIDQRAVKKLSFFDVLRAKASSTIGYRTIRVELSYVWVKRVELTALKFFFEAQISFRSHQATLTLLQEDSGCGAVVERTPHNR